MYEPDPSGVRIHFESKGLGTFCVNMGAYNHEPVMMPRLLWTWWPACEQMCVRHATCIVLINILLLHGNLFCEILVLLYNHDGCCIRILLCNKCDYLSEACESLLGKHMYPCLF
jgi:hypothetical protein